MKINNSLEAGKYRLYIILSFMVILISVFFMIFDRIDIVNIVILILGLFSLVYLIYKSPHFVQFETTHREIIFKYYSVFPFFRKPKALKIPIHSFNKYEISTKAGKKNIIIHIKTGKKIGKYPPVNLSIVPKQMIEEIKKELDYILKVKNTK